MQVTQGQTVPLVRGEAAADDDAVRTRPHEVAALAAKRRLVQAAEVGRQVNLRIEVQRDRDEGRARGRHEAKEKS